MKGYLIKVTYLTGSHAGESWFMRKSGFVTEADSIQWKDDVYLSLGHAKRACERYTFNNQLDYKFEREDAKTRVKKGRNPKKYWIYELELYEPYETNYIEY